MIDMTADAVARLEHEANALSQLATASTCLNEAFGHVNEADHEHARLADHFASLAGLQGLATEALRERARRRATQIGWQVATYVIEPIARGSGDEPIAWVTGNSYMPPLRDIAACEAVWQADFGDLELFALMAEALERRLDELHVYMGVPEYDNAIYVVDLERFFEHVETEGDSLANEWRRKAPLS